MKSNRKTNRVISVILCCVMLLGLLPMTALAINVSRVEVQIEAPVAGKPLDAAPTGNTDQYTVGSGGGNVASRSATARIRGVKPCRVAALMGYTTLGATWACSRAR